MNNYKGEIMTNTERTKLIEALAALIITQTITRLCEQELDCDCNLDSARNVVIKKGKKYTKIDQDGSGKFMITEDGEIFGIKGYGKIHKGHHYGNITDTSGYFWGDYRPQTVGHREGVKKAHADYVVNKGAITMKRDDIFFVIDWINKECSSEKINLGPEDMDDLYNDYCEDIKNKNRNSQE